MAGTGDVDAALPGTAKPSLQEGFPAGRFRRLLAFGGLVLFAAAVAATVGRLLATSTGGNRIGPSAAAATAAAATAAASPHPTGAPSPPAVNANLLSHEDGGVKAMYPKIDESAPHLPDAIQRSSSF